MNNDLQSRIDHIDEVIKRIDNISLELYAIRDAEMERLEALADDGDDEADRHYDMLKYGEFKGALDALISPLIEERSQLWDQSPDPKYHGHYGVEPL